MENAIEDDDEFVATCFRDGKPYVLSEQCATCIYRPGNKMNLRPGRLKAMTELALCEGSQGVICHDTLVKNGGALCRGFYDMVGHKNNFVRIMERLGGFQEADPPNETDAQDTSHQGDA